MKWCNKNKTDRREHWATVKAPSQENAKLAADWCRAQTSTGSFYNHYTNTRFWFEEEADAIMFTLTWANR